MALGKVDNSQRRLSVSSTQSWGHLGGWGITVSSTGAPSGPLGLQCLVGME